MMNYRLAELNVVADDATSGGTNPGRDDVVRVSRNASLPYAIDFDLNGETFTADFAKLGFRTYWSLSTGFGNDRVEVTFAEADASAAGVFSSFTVAGGPGDDELVNGATYAILSGAEGNDTLRGGPAGEVLYGGDGVDKLYGNAGDDILYVGNYGSKWLEGEVYEGGPGDDQFGLGSTLTPLPDDGPVGTPSPVPAPEPTPTPTTPPPEPVIMAAYSGKRLVRKGRRFDFNVLFARPRNGRMDPGELGTDDVAVTGPGGTLLSVRLVRTRRVKGALLARYRVAAPRGVFDAGDNGAYTVQFRTSATPPAAAPAPRQFQRLVLAPQGAASRAAQDLGTFEVRAKARPSRPME